MKKVLGVALLALFLLTPALAADTGNYETAAVAIFSYGSLFMIFFSMKALDPEIEWQAWIQKLFIGLSLLLMCGSFVVGMNVAEVFNSTANSTSAGVHDLTEVYNLNETFYIILIVVTFIYLIIFGISIWIYLYNKFTNKNGDDFP